jgi:hypothetical protein
MFSDWTWMSDWDWDDEERAAIRANANRTGYGFFEVSLAKTRTVAPKVQEQQEI